MQKQTCDYQCQWPCCYDRVCNGEQQHSSDPKLMCGTTTATIQALCHDVNYSLCLSPAIDNQSDISLLIMLRAYIHVTWLARHHWSSTSSTLLKLVVRRMTCMFTDCVNLIRMQMRTSDTSRVEQEHGNKSAATQADLALKIQGTEERLPIYSV